MDDTPKHSVSVAGIVVDDHDRVLIIQRRDNGHWEPPGGVLELEEAPEDGVRREVLEETGLQVDVQRLSGIYKNMKLGVVSLVFRCTRSGGTEGPSDESATVKWMSLPQVDSLTTEAYAVRFRDAFHDGPFVRTHDGTKLLKSTSR